MKTLLTFFLSLFVSSFSYADFKYVCALEFEMIGEGIPFVYAYLDVENKSLKTSDFFDDFEESENLHFLIKEKKDTLSFAPTRLKELGTLENALVNARSNGSNPFYPGGLYLNFDSEDLSVTGTFVSSPEEVSGVKSIECKEMGI